MTNQTLSFPQAIAITQSLMNQISTNQLSETEIERQIVSIIKTKDGGRGFFVSFLTSDLSLADNPTSGIINALKSSVEIVSELLVKNLAMSSAMSVTQGRSGDLENLEGSQRVCQRTVNLVRQLELQLVKDELVKLQNTIDGKEKHYEDFLQHWGYDFEQQKAIQKTILDILG